MAGCGCQEKDEIMVQRVNDVPVDVVTTLPQYLLAVRAVEDPLSGDTVEAIIKLPTGRVLPNGIQENVFALTANNDTLEIPAKQVRAGAIQNLGSAYAVQYDDSEREARFLLLGTESDVVYCQSTGVVNLLAGHEYIIGQDYYASADGTGEPVTSPESGVHLFYVLSRTQLLVDIKEA